MNQVILIGRLTKDADVSYTATSKAMAKFTLAVDRPNKEGDQTADFIRITAWNKTAELINRYTHKGSQIAIIGRIQTGSYDNRNGEKVYTTDIIADKVEFLGGSKEKITEVADNIAKTFSGTPFKVVDDDLPF